MLPTDQDWAELILEVLELTNAFRESKGRAPLKLNEKLTIAAQGHVEDMAERDYFAHNSPDGEGIGERINATGYNYSTAGENIAAGFLSAESVVNAWIESPGHLANLLNTSYTEIGLGYFYEADDHGPQFPPVGDELGYYHYWGQAFGHNPDGVVEFDVLDTVVVPEPEPEPAPPQPNEPPTQKYI